jgi:hypothetical protein
MINPLAPVKDAYSVAVAAVNCGAMDIYGELVDPTKLSDRLLADLIFFSKERARTELLIAEQERRNS